MSDTPTRIGPYAIERRLGAGGMAETFIALRRMQSIEQRVCLKRILPAYARNAEARKLFHREANISARLRHGNLVQVLDVGEDQGTPYLVMELVEGCDLDHVLERAPDRRLSPELVGYILSEIAHGLHEAHGGDGAHQGVVHRDLSPSNVLLSMSGEVKVADFGIAKALSGDKATATAMRGKFAYMAPEQLDGAPLDPRADMFALGVMGFEMLAGVRPFDAAVDSRLIMMITKNERRPIAELAPGAPRELLETIEALLSPRKEARPATGHDVVERLAPMLPAAVVARRQLGKLVTAAYEARIDAMAREPHTGQVVSSEPGLAATQLASGAATPATRPAGAAVSAAATPMAVTAVAPEPTTERSATPVRAGSRSSTLVVGLGALAALSLVAVVGVYASGGGGTPEVSAPVLPPTSIAPPVAHAPPTTVAVAAPATTTPAPPTTATPPPVSSIASAPPPTTSTRRGHAPQVPATTTESATMPTSIADDDPHETGGDRGHLHIVASPWGQIWIDGRFMGRAPIDAMLRPGSHRIQAGFAEPTTARTVRVRAGADERVELEVE